MKSLPWLRIRNLLLTFALATLSSAVFAQIQVSITIAPPALPIYEQPPCPAPNYIWTPGYWAWAQDGYFWVPGTWVEAPAVGLLWTPGYWGWDNGRYLWNAGYWGPEVGFYGGVDYGYGYDGDGFYGGRWQGRYFNYNTAVVRVSPDIRRTYVNRVRSRPNRSRVSFNGGHGIQARPSPAERNARNRKRFGPVTAQMRQASAARDYRQNYARVNHGTPAHLATQRPVTSAAAFGKSAPAHETRSNGAKPNAGRSHEGRPGAAKPNAARPGAHSSPARPETHPAFGAIPKANPENHTNAHPENRSGAKAHPASHPENRPETHPGANSNVRPARRPEPRPTSHPEPTRAPHSNARPEAHTNPPAAQPHHAEPPSRPESQPHPEAQPRQNAHPEASPQPRPESHPQARPQSRPESHPEAKPHPEARPESHSAKPEGNQHKEKPHSDSSHET